MMRNQRPESQAFAVLVSSFMLMTTMKREHVHHFFKLDHEVSVQIKGFNYIENFLNFELPE